MRYKAATLLATFGVIFAPFGIWLAHRISNQFLSLIFATVLTYVAWRMWQQSEEAPKVDTNQPAQFVKLTLQLQSYFGRHYVLKGLCLLVVPLDFSQVYLV